MFLKRYRLLRTLRHRHFSEPEVIRNYVFGIANRDGTPEDLNADRFPLLLHLYAGSIRNRAPSLPLRQELLKRLEDKPRLRHPADLYELCLVLFSEKDWPRLAEIVPDAIESVAAENAQTQSEILADLGYLTKHRLVADIHLPSKKKLEAWLRQARPRLVPEQQRLHEACDVFLKGGLSSSRAEIAAAVKDYKPRFALRGLRTVFCEAEIDTSLTGPPPPVMLRKAASPDVVLVSANEKYFLDFGHLFLRWFQELAPAVSVHFHCIDFIPSMEDFPENCGFSTEDTTGELGSRGESTVFRRSYFASARYLHLGYFLTQYRRIKVTDIDGAITKAVNDWQAEAVCFHSELTVSPRDRLPMEAVSASAVSVRQSDEARVVAEYLRRYIVHGLSHNTEDPWYIDQAALFAAWQDLKDKVKIATNRPRFYSQGGNWTLVDGFEDKLKRAAGAQLDDARSP